MERTHLGFECIWNWPNSPIIVCQSSIWPSMIIGLVLFCPEGVLVDCWKCFRSMLSLCSLGLLYLSMDLVFIISTPFFFNHPYVYVYLLSKCHSAAEKSKGIWFVVFQYHLPVMLYKNTSREVVAFLLTCHTWHLL